MELTGQQCNSQPVGADQMMENRTVADSEVGRSHETLEQEDKQEKTNFD